MKVMIMSRSRVRAEELELLGRMFVVLFRQHPVCRSLEDMQLARDLGDLRNALHPAGRTADHRNSQAGEIKGLIPCTGVHRYAGERFATLDHGDGQFAEHALTADEDLGGEFLSRIGHDGPGGVRVTPRCGAHACAESEEWSETKPIDGVTDVGEDLGLGRV
jgi:hypothetical protein